MSDRFFVTYDLRPHPEGIAREDVPDGHGGADAVLIASIMRQPEGGQSILFVTLDGAQAPKGKALSALDHWKVWAMLTDVLAEEPSLADLHRDICRNTMRRIRQGFDIQGPV